MALPARIRLSANADEVVDVRLLMLKLPEGSVTISDMGLKTRGYQYLKVAKYH